MNEQLENRGIKTFRQLTQVKFFLAISILVLAFTTNQSVLAQQVYEDFETGESIVLSTKVVEDVSVVSEEIFTIPTYTNTEINTYPMGQCTWGVKVLADWVGDYWGNAADWVASAQLEGYELSTLPKQGAVAVWFDGGYGHVAYVIDVQSETAIQVLESNYAGNMAIANYRGLFDPTDPTWGSVLYIYPKD